MYTEMDTDGRGKGVVVDGVENKQDEKRSDPVTGRAKYGKGSKREDTG